MLNQPIEQTPPPPPVMGLLASARRPAEPDRTTLDGSSELDRIPAWAARGIEYERPGCIQPQGVFDPCSARVETISDSELVEWRAYDVAASYRCGLIGGNQSLQSYTDRAVARLRLIEQQEIEAELWAGARAQAEGWPNLWLTSAGATVLTAAPATAALACLVQYLSSNNGGSQGMIHATPQVVSLWAAAHMVYRRDRILYSTWGDHVVVGGGGYSGVMAVATDMVDVRLGPVSVAGDTVDQIDMRNNTAVVRASRPALASWDGCRHAQVTITDVTACG